MGMFDSFYDERGNEWQTKAYGCLLDQYHVGDSPSRGAWPDSYPTTYQVEVLGDDGDSFTTVTDDVVTSINDRRDSRLPLINYSGHLVAEGI